MKITVMKNVILLAALALLVSGCKVEQLASQLEQASSSSSSTSSSGASSSLSTATLKSETEDAAEEVSGEEACQASEPDFAAIKEALVARLTALIAKLEAVDTSSFDEEQLAKHEAFLADVQADLETVNAATELSDELKEIARRVWRAPRGHGHGGPRGDGECHAAVREEHKDRQCRDIENLLALDDLSDSLREALESRYAEICESDGSTSTDGSSTE